MIRSAMVFSLLVPAVLLDSSSAFAAGPVGTPPAGGFSIDDVSFDPGNLAATPCPAGNTCITLPGSGAGMLQRELTDMVSGNRFVQTIVVDADGDASFANESRVAMGTNSIAAKLRIDDPWIDPQRAFFTEHTFYRGSFDASGGFPAFELVQTLGGDYQRFAMETPGIPNNGASMSVGRIAIDQASEDAVFAHRILRGAGYAPTDFSLSVSGGVDTRTLERSGAVPGGLTATYVRGMIGEELSSALIYRFFSADAADGPVTAGDTTTGAAPSEEISALSLHAGAAGLGWDETLFGPAP